MKIAGCISKFYQGKGLLISGFVIVILLIILPLIIPSLLKPDPITVGLITGIDALPFHLGVDKPIFLENRLAVKIKAFENERERDQAFINGEIEVVLCDLPSAVLVTGNGERGQIIRSVLRSNPIRPLYAIFSQNPVRREPGVLSKDQPDLEKIAVPDRLGFHYLVDMLWQDTGRGGGMPDKITVSTPMKAYDMLEKGDSSLALLRLPWTTLAEKEGFFNFIDDRRNLFGMSVLVIALPITEKKPQVLKRFLYAFEQAILELNYRPYEYSYILKEKGGLPEAIKESFLMPIYEGPNVPAESEMEKVEDWLIHEGLLPQKTPYKKLVNLRFLPDPDRVTRAACCL